ncbi:MAG: protein kinase [Synechococcales cyanobacterium RU_4_20]|nr:protein kinase [Synechococcales cyanobacterium RU_4_20]
MNGDRCQQPQCTGTLEDDYCNLCGMAHQPNLSAVQTHTSQTHASRRLNSQTLNSQTLNSHRTARSGLGLGLVSLPPLPATDPEALLLQDPSVPANKRFCGSCDHPVRRDQGFCGRCGRPYSFVASLKAGDMVAQQYDVKGAIAYGGLGWIYLGFDRVLSRYVVLKGLLNTADDSSAAVALAERQFLAAVKHPNIVGVYNFVTHENPLTGQSEGFIVMEYVAGQTLRQLRRERGPLPVAEAIAYIHGILGAFGYLHDQGLVYCDFKPDNLMLEGQSVRLIDMGAVRRLDDPLGDIYGTVGYSAPEAGAGPTVASDLFTVGRTLAVLVATVPEFSETHRYQLPGPDQVPLFAQWESLYRWLCKATAPQPENRFQSADEMAEQLAGVLREVVALETGRSIPSQSRYFGGDTFLAPVDLSPADLSSADLSSADLSSADLGHLPPLLADPEDPAYGLMLPLLTLAIPRPNSRYCSRCCSNFPRRLGLSSNAFKP